MHHILLPLVTIHHIHHHLPHITIPCVTICHKFQYLVLPFVTNSNTLCYHLSLLSHLSPFCIHFLPKLSHISSHLLTFATICHAFHHFELNYKTYFVTICHTFHTLFSSFVSNSITSCYHLSLFATPPPFVTHFITLCYHHMSYLSNNSLVFVTLHQHLSLIISIHHINCFSSKYINIHSISLQFIKCFFRSPSACSDSWTQTLDLRIMSWVFNHQTTGTYRTFINSKHQSSSFAIHCIHHIHHNLWPIVTIHHNSSQFITIHHDSLHSSHFIASITIHGYLSWFISFITIHHIHHNSLHSSHNLWLFVTIRHLILILFRWPFFFVKTREHEWLGATTFSITTLSITTISRTSLSITTISRTTLSITTISIMTLRIKGLFAQTV